MSSPKSEDRKVKSEQEIEANIPPAPPVEPVHTREAVPDSTVPQEPTEPAKSKEPPTTPEEAAERLQDHLGDLTPAYVKWIRKHALPHEFEAIYAGRDKEVRDAL